MKDLFTFLSDPAHLVFMIPIVAILGVAINKGLKNYYAHKERMAGLDPHHRED